MTEPMTKTFYFFSPLQFAVSRTTSSSPDIAPSHSVPLLLYGTLYNI